jgi:hypothetical protein
MSTLELIIHRNPDQFEIREASTGEVAYEAPTLEQCFAQIGRSAHCRNGSQIHFDNHIPVDEQHGNLAGEWLMLGGYHESIHQLGPADRYFVEPACAHCGLGVRNHAVPLASADESPTCEIQSIHLARDVIYDGQTREAGPFINLYAGQLLNAMDPTGEIFGISARTEIVHASGDAMYEIGPCRALPCIAARDCQEIGIGCRMCQRKYVNSTPGFHLNAVQYFIREETAKALGTDWFILDTGHRREIVIHKDIAPRVLSAAGSGLLTTYHIAVVPHALERLIKYSWVWGN